MRITKLYIKSYKNLQEFEWELNPESPVAVIVGKNASGKSNLLEAILLIFAQVRTNKTSKDFQFEIQYQDIEQNLIILKNEGNDFTCTKDSVPIDVNKVFPKQIVAYYAGITSRMEKLVRQYRKEQNKTQDFDIVYTQPIHFKFALLALLGSRFDTVKNDLLLGKFKIESFIRFAIRIQKPSYSLSKEANKDNFWLAPTNLKIFFQTLVECGEVKESLADYTITFQKEDMKKLMDSPIVNDESSNLFELLSESYANEFIQNVDIRFKKEGVLENLRFDDLSEGEKQKIGIRGIVELFLGKETLFLLDEPDAFAHPRWQWEFVPDFVEVFKEGPQSSQIIFVTHSPLVLSTVRDNAFMMENGGIKPIYGTYGQDVTFSLAKMGADDRLEKVQKKLDAYFAFLQSGMSKNDEAKELKKELENILGINHPELLRASVIETLYE